ncbi:serine-rich adhesin for platelets [Pempheris klunzingeri]|uniref:serine-rich adhesin for platelets n=1 Tax=Pempheris klunzingeri TaxID=3127111 RepID=UPI00397FD6E7
MLSSTVVTVLAPHWSGRPRRTKRFDGTSNSEAQGNLQDHAHERFQETLEGSLSGGSQAQLRVPFLGTRRNTVGWSTKSGPASLDYESKRKMIQTVSLDVNTGRMDNRNIGAGALSPEATTASPVSPFSLEPNGQRRNPQTGNQGGLPSLSSKPTTSSLLLSLRRFNSNSRNSNTDSTVSEINPSSLNSSPSDRDGKIFTTNLSPTFNNNEQERSKPLLSPSFISYRTTETGPIISPSCSNHRERNMFETRFCSASPTNKDTDNTPFTQQSQTINRTYSNLPSSKRVFLSGEQSESQQNSRSSDKSTNQFSSPRQSPYDHSAVPKTHSIPRRTILTSTSWWKQVTQEGSSPLKLNDITNIKNNPNTTLVPPCNDNSDLASPSQTDNKRFSGQIPNNTDNNNTAEPVHKGNLNHVLNTQGGTHNLQQRNAEDSPDRESDRFVKQQYGSNLNNREPQKLHSLPSVMSSSKISIATVQTTLIHPKNLIKHDVSNSSFIANATELPPPLQNLKSSNTPTESSSKYNINHFTPALASSPSITISSLLTPPATPIITSPNYSDTSSPKEGKTFSSSQESDSKPREGKRALGKLELRSFSICNYPTLKASPRLEPQHEHLSLCMGYRRSTNPTSNTSPVTSVQAHVQTSQPFLPYLSQLTRSTTANGQPVLQRASALPRICIQP